MLDAPSPVAPAVAPPSVGAARALVHGVRVRFWLLLAASTAAEVNGTVLPCGGVRVRVDGDALKDKDANVDVVDVVDVVDLVDGVVVAVVVVVVVDVSVAVVVVVVAVVEVTVVVVIIVVAVVRVVVAVRVVVVVVVSVVVVVGVVVVVVVVAAVVLVVVVGAFVGAPHGDEGSARRDGSTILCT